MSAPSAAPAVAPPAPDAPPRPVPGNGPARGEALAALGDRIARLSAHISAATYRLLTLIAAFDVAEGWQAAGFRSCARWLAWRTGTGPGAAREKVRVARALAELPVLSEALRKGELSYSMARAITRVATPADEAELVEAARHATVAEIERLVRAWRRADRTEAAERAEERARHAGRRLSLVPTADGSWRISGRLDPEVGALLAQAVAAAEEQLFRAEGGETSLGNLVLLCRRHHRLVHEGGWSLERAAGGAEDEAGAGSGGNGTARPRFRFLRPDGRILDRGPDRPAVPDAPVRALVDDQRALAIDAGTATPRNDEHGLDVDWALFTLRGPLEIEHTGELDVSAGTPCEPGG